MYNTSELMVVQQERQRLAAQHERERPYQIVQRLYLLTDAATTWVKTIVQLYHGIRVANTHKDYVSGQFISDSYYIGNSLERFFSCADHVGSVWKETPPLDSISHDEEEGFKSLVRAADLVRELWRYHDDCFEDLRLERSLASVPRNDYYEHRGRGMKALRERSEVLEDRRSGNDALGMVGWKDALRRYSPEDVW